MAKVKKMGGHEKSVHFDAKADGGGKRGTTGGTREGGWDGQFGGIAFKGKGGEVAFTGLEKGKGTTSAGASTGEKQDGQSQYLGHSGNRGVAQKDSKFGKGKGWTSQEAAVHE